jgi:hypothetical protein
VQLCLALTINRDTARWRRTALTQSNSRAHSNAGRVETDFRASRLGGAARDLFRREYPDGCGAGSVKRVVTAAEEGAVAVHFFHRCLARSDPLASRGARDPSLRVPRPPPAEPPEGFRPYETGGMHGALWT